MQRSQPQEAAAVIGKNILTVGGAQQGAESWGCLLFFPLSDEIIQPNERQRRNRNEFVSQKYAIYYQGKVAEWDKATRRIDAAAHVGNKIAEGTLFIIGAGTMAGAYVAYGGVAVLKMLAKGFVGSTVAGMLTSSGGPDGGCGTLASIGGGAVGGGCKVGGEAAATEAEASVIIQGSTDRTFYTVQNEANASRLQSGGIPWPTEPTKTHLGEGLYSWGSRSQAEAYQSHLESLYGVSGLNILEARIPQAQYQSLRSLDLRGLSDEAAHSWLESHSALFGAGEPHGLDHVIRETGNFGPEFFFSKDVFPFFQIK